MSKNETKSYKIELPVEFTVKAKYVTFIKANSYEEAREKAINRVHDKKVDKKSFIDETFCKDSVKLDGTKNDIVFTYNGRGFTKEDINLVGRETASLWGAECVSFEIEREDNYIAYGCIECGENFVTNVDFEDFIETLDSLR